MYEIVNVLDSQVITRTDDDGKVWFIPADENNSDYQAYLAYLAEQETA
jgi:hypothetical protein